jgi:hypothetical protein
MTAVTVTARPHARTPQGPTAASGPRALQHPGHDLRLVNHSRNGAKPTSPWGHTRTLARLLPEAASYKSLYCCSYLKWFSLSKLSMVNECWFAKVCTEFA